MDYSGPYFAALERENLLREQVSRLTKMNLEYKLHITALESNAAGHAAHKQVDLDSGVAILENCAGQLPSPAASDSSPLAGEGYSFEDAIPDCGTDSETSSCSAADVWENSSVSGFSDSTDLTSTASDEGCDAADSTFQWSSDQGELSCEGQSPETTPVSGEAWTPDIASAEEWEAEALATAAATPKVSSKFGDRERAALVKSTRLYDSFASSPASVVFAPTPENRDTLTKAREVVQEAIWEFFETHRLQERKQNWDHQCAIQLEREELRSYWKSAALEPLDCDLVEGAVSLRNTVSHLGGDEKTEKVDLCLQFAQAMCIELLDEQRTLIIRALRDEYQHRRQAAFEAILTLGTWEEEGPAPELLQARCIEVTLQRAGTKGDPAQKVVKECPAFRVVVEHWNQCFEKPGGTRRQVY